MANRLISYSLGALKSPHDARDYVYSFIKPITAALPEKFFLKEWPVNNQGEYGTCVGQACSAIKDWQETKERGEAIDTSPLFVYSKCKEIDGLPGQAGTHPRAAMKVLVNQGICREKTFPYLLITDDKNPPKASERAEQEAKDFIEKSYARVNTIEEIKQAVMSDGPVLIAVLWTSGMNDPESGGFMPIPYGYMLGGHALAITGWDDNLEHVYSTPYKGKTKFTGFFRVRNSWGPEWGDNGYCWFPYDMFIEKLDTGMPYIMEAWTAVDVVVNPPKRPEPPEPEPEPGEIKQFDVAPLILDGRTMLELRSLAIITGATYVDWLENEQKVILYYPNRVVHIWVGKKEYRVIDL